MESLNSVDGTVYGKHNVVQMINPHTSYFIAYYSNDTVVKGNNLFSTGWDVLPDGILKLQYRLSTGHIIEIPKFRAYLSLIEVSESVQTGNKIFHAINVKCLGDNEVINYRIVLKQDRLSKHKIGDIIVTKEKSIVKSKYWKFSS